MDLAFFSALFVWELLRAPVLMKYRPGEERMESFSPKCPEFAPAPSCMELFNMI